MQVGTCRGTEWVGTCRGTEWVGKCRGTEWVGICRGTEWVGTSRGTEWVGTSIVFPFVQDFQRLTNLRFYSESHECCIGFVSIVNFYFVEIDRFHNLMKTVDFTFKKRKTTV